MSEILKKDARIEVIKDGDFVIKKYKLLNKMGNKILLSKLEAIDEFKEIKGLILPKDYTVKDGFVTEIYTPYIDKPNLYSTSRSKEVFDLETISLTMTNLSNLLKDCHKKGFISLDFGTEGNVKYDPKTKDVFLLDYEDSQVKKNPAFGFSFVFNMIPIIKDKKYTTNGLYTPNGLFTSNADNLLLALKWFSLCTSTDLIKMMGSNKDQASNVLKNFGCDDIELQNKMDELFKPNVQNDYFDKDFLRVNENYDLIKEPVMSLIGLNTRLFRPKNNK